MEKVFKTKLTSVGEAIETKAVIDFEGVTREELEKLAAATVIINQQAIYRTSGLIPAKDTIKVREQLDRPRGGGFKSTPESLAARANTLDREGYRKFLTNAGLDLTEAQIEKMLVKKFGS